jgi:hypothetical protein
MLVLVIINSVFNHCRFCFKFSIFLILIINRFLKIKAKVFF